MKIGYCICGSFCMHKKSLSALQKLSEKYEIVPVLSERAAHTDTRFGKLSVEVLDENGKPFPGYSAADCKALSRKDSTKHALTWTGGDLARFAGKPVRFRFRMKVATLFSFWVAKKPTGESGGYVAAGGPDYKGLKDE